MSKEKKKKLSWRVLAGAAPVFALILTVGIGAVFFPLEIEEFKTWVQWRHLGVRAHVAPNGWEWEEWNRCQPHQPCACILFVHGLGDQALTWKRLWEREAAASSVPLRLLAVQLPGSGNTPLPNQNDQLRVRSLGAELAQAMMPQCAEVTLVGNSLGGAVAVWAAVQNPQWVRKLLLLAPSGILWHELSPQLDFTVGGVAALKEFQRRAYFHPREIPERVWLAIGRRAQAQVAPRALKQAQVPEDQLFEPLQGLKATVALGWGAADRILPSTDLQAWKTRVPSAVVHYWERCGHLPQKECPALVWSALMQLQGAGAM